MEVNKTVEAAHENARLAYKELLGQRELQGIPESATDFNLKEYWLSLNTSVDALVSEIKKLTTFFKKPSLAEQQLEEQVRNIESLYEVILAKYYNLAKDQGQVMRKKLKLTLLRLIDGLQALFGAIQGYHSRSNEDYIQVSSYISEVCQEVKQLPRDNRSAIIQDLDKGDVLIADGLRDIEDEIKSQESGVLGLNGEEVDNTERWNNQERQFLWCCMALIKTARSCFRRIRHAVRARAHCNMVQEVSELDELGKAVCYLNLNIDEFVSSVFPPMNRADIRSMAKDLVDDLHGLLLIVRDSHYITEEDQAWIRCLLKDVDHNNNKLQPLLDS